MDIARATARRTPFPLKPIQASANAASDPTSKEVKVVIEATRTLLEIILKKGWSVKTDWTCWSVGCVGKIGGREVNSDSGFKAVMPCHRTGPKQKATTPVKRRKKIMCFIRVGFLMLKAFASNLSQEVSNK
jgi:hypothetical protein